LFNVSRFKKWPRFHKSDLKKQIEGIKQQHTNATAPLIVRLLLALSIPFKVIVWKNTECFLWNAKFAKGDIKSKLHSRITWKLTKAY
jgi:hypothetical protein